MRNAVGKVRSGPPADPNALVRERDGKEWTTLPAHREGPAPDWPLTRPSARERVLWDREWTRPQAVMWEQFGLTVEVALFVRALAVAERPEATVSQRTLVRQMMDSLRITEPGLRAARWRIESPDAPPVRTDDDRRTTAKARLQVIDGKVIAS